MFKLFSILIVFAAIIFFVVGGGLAFYEIISINTYALFGGIVGSIASTIGLLAFASPRLTAKDVLSVESQLVQRLADATTSLNDYEARISANKDKLEQIQRDRLEIEILVRQASVKVFLEEKLRRLSVEVDNRVGADTTLVEWISEYERTKINVSEIDGEITKSSRAELIKEIVGDFDSKEKKLFIHIGGFRLDASPVLRFSEHLVATIASGFLGMRR